MQRGFDGSRRQRKHPGESLRIAAGEKRQLIVGDSRDGDGVVRLKTVRARWRNAEDLPVDPKPVHMLDSALNISPLKRNGIDAAPEILIVEIDHSAVSVRCLHNYAAMRLLHRTQILF